MGITLDAAAPSGYSKFPWLALRENYPAAVVHAGGLPVMLPHEPEQVDRYLDLLDGLIISGGNFDVDPTLFGASARHPTVKTKDRRTAFELAITRGALARDLPVFGIGSGHRVRHINENRTAPQRAASPAGGSRRGLLQPVR